MLAAWTAAPATAQSVPALSTAHPACAAERSLPDVAADLQALAPDVRAALRAMVTSADGPARRCGLRGLAALRDAGVPALVAATLDLPAWRQDLYLVLRWAAFAAGGPDPVASAAYAGLAAAIVRPDVLREGGDDAYRLLGEIEADEARNGLVEALGRPQADAAFDAVVHALARQGDRRPLAAIAAAGHEAADGLSTNPTYEQARRIAAAAFYLLALGDDTRDDGLALLGKLQPTDQADTAAWTLQTLCERAVRRPAAGAAATARAAGLAPAFAARGIRWDHLVRGAFPCPARP